jgi:hypothetical protein
MTPKLTSEQRQAIDAQQPGQPVYVVDADTQEKWVLVPDGTYQKIRALIGDDTFDIRETYPLQEKAAGAAGWDDPAMDDYNDYDAHRKTQ